MLRTWMLLFLSLTAAPVYSQISEFWFYLPTNLLVEENVLQCEALLKRASVAGYTHCLITDSKFCRLDEMPERYFQHVNRLKKFARQVQIEIVPAVFPIGYSNDLLYADPNLIESMPVRNLAMTVRSGLAEVDEPKVPLKSSNFESGNWDWKDDTVQLVAGVARVKDPQGKVARIVQRVKLRPLHQYHLSLRVRTKDFQGVPEAKWIAGERVLNHDYLKVARSQNWTEHHVVFNSLEYEEASLYLGCWDGRSGTLEWDDVRLEVEPFINLTRRPGCPLVVTDSAGNVLVEGKDFEPLSDPLLGTQPYAGVYTIYHNPPRLRTKGIADGTKLRVSYYHAVTVHDDQANICPSEPASIELLRAHAKAVHQLWNANRYWMSHDEIRVYNWCNACQKRNMTSGEMLADNVAECIRILSEIAPAARIYVWSDMFDPNHNAKDNYYLARGTFEGSWNGLDPKVVIAPWYREAREKTLPFFADRGHRQIIAGFYDGPVDQVDAWLETAKNVSSVEAIMYTTWERDYSQLESFIERVRKQLKRKDR